MRTPHVVIIGAGMGGLVAALDLAVHGLAVTLVERADVIGGKLAHVDIAGATIDVGPTVLTMRDVFEAIFARAGTTLADHLTLRPASLLARHAWNAEARLDLFADPRASEQAIGVFAGAAAARGFHRFCRDARAIFKALETPFLRARTPRLKTLLAGAGISGLLAMARVSPFRPLWRALETYFPDPRLRQLFARYATYCGAAPTLAPATLMLIAHVEQSGVWLVEGGMYRLAEALRTLALTHGARLRTRSEVAEILAVGGRACGVRLASGEEIAADAVIANGDVAALAGGLFGDAGRRAVSAIAGGSRSLSAMTWAMRADVEGFPLAHHLVFFSPDYEAEFSDIVTHGRLPGRPSVYLCAQDRDDRGAWRASTTQAPAGGERLFCIVNAPACGDQRPLTDAEITRCEAATLATLARCGLSLRSDRAKRLISTPADFAARFPATGGALYGRAIHGWQESFRRPGARTSLPGLYLAGGSVHPGAGLPMAALSGGHAAMSLLADLASTSRLHPVGMFGGISTPSATTLVTASR